MRKLVLVAAVWVVTGAFAAGAQAAVTPYGTDDAGGFRNVLPPGENGLDNAADLALFRAAGVRPAHSFDQQGLYQDLLLGSPGLTDAQIPNFFKDATFGVKPGDVESSTSPRPGVTILRDKGYGVPHIYGTTRDDTMFGAGYAGAQDRLFLMDVLRHTGRAELSSFVGGLGQQPGDGPHPVGAGALHRVRPAVPDRLGRASLRGGRRARAAGPGRLRGRHQRLHRPDPPGPHQAARRVRGAGQAAPALEGHRRDRHLVAGGWHLRQGRWLRGALRPGRGGLHQALRPEEGAQGLVGLPVQERPRGLDHGQGQALPVRDGQRLRQAGAGHARPRLRCATRPWRPR